MFSLDAFARTGENRTRPGSRLWMACLGLACVGLIWMAPKLQAQTIEFSDDFESGLSAWTLTGTWGTSTAYAFSGSNALADSPTGNYVPNTDATATLATPIDLSTALDATLNFQAVYDIEAGFDYCYVEAQADGGTWVTLDAFDGEGLLSPWVGYSYSLGGFVGSSSVLIRFRFFSDGAVEYDGIFIDDVEVTSSSTDLGPPLVLHDGPELYEGAAGDFAVQADLIDISGIASTWLRYTVDGGPLDSVAGTLVSGDTWQYTVPGQAPGALVEYSLRAVDASPAGNTAWQAGERYLAGTTIKYDNGTIDFVNSFGPMGLSGDGCAVRISLAGASDVVSMLIRNYTDPTRPNEDMIVHVWDDAFGAPGADLIAPFAVSPAATLAEPNLMTYIDLRPYSASLSGVSGDIWIGFETPVGQTWVQQTTPGIGGRTSILSGGLWTAITDDYHFRVVTGPAAGAPTADFSIDASADPTVAFTDASTNSPTSWDWSFGDGNTDNVANPSNTYAANGSYTVCLTAGNAVGSDTECKMVDITGVLFPPSVAWSVDTSGDPTFVFSDASSGSPDAWAWDFGDGNSSTDPSPSHTYAANGVYTVCHSASNAAGSSPDSCRDITVREVPSGLGQPEVLSLNCYPNPATDQVQMVLPQAFAYGEPATWTLYDIQGRILGQGPLPNGVERWSLDLSDRAPGTYTLEWRSGAQRALGKVLIQR
jgi:hypothetical protein